MCRICRFECVSDKNKPISGKVSKVFTSYLKKVALFNGALKFSLKSK